MHRYMYGKEAIEWAYKHLQSYFHNQVSLDAIVVLWWACVNDHLPI